MNTAAAESSFFDADFAKQALSHVAGATVFGLIVLGTTLYVDRETKAHVEASERATKAHVDAVERATKAHVDAVERATKAHVDAVERATKAYVNKADTKLNTFMEKTKDSLTFTERFSLGTCAFAVAIVVLAKR